VAAVSYKPPDSVIVDRIKRAFPSDELRERARAMNLVQRERKFDTVALFYTLSLGFAAGSDRSIQAFLERFVEMADCDELAYPTFHGWFSPAFVALLREILDDRGIRAVAPMTRLLSHTDQSTERALWHEIQIGLLRPISCFTLS
jgi:hypothetical protein